MLVLTRAVYDAVLDHAAADAPREACGVLAGTHDEDAEGSVPAATAAHPTANAAPTPRTRYAIDPEELYAVVTAVERAGRQVVGFYHSHPAGPSSPSETDHRQATWAGHHYVIASLAGPQPTLDAWVWTGEAFARDAVCVRDGDADDAAGTRRP